MSWRMSASLQPLFIGSDKPRYRPMAAWLETQHSDCYNFAMTRQALRCDLCAVRDQAACAALDIRERHALAKLGHHRALRRGETVFAAGDDNAIAATLTKGVLKISSFDEDGTEHIVSLVHPAGFAGELFTPLVHHDVVALTDCELCVFPREHYEQALERFPELGRALLRRSSQDLLDTRSLLAAVTSRRAGQRVTGFLLAMGYAANGVECHPANEFDMVLTRGEVASLLGLTIETVSRQLSKLERDGVIRRRGARGIQLVNAGQLRTLASSGRT